MYFLHIFYGIKECGGRPKLCVTQSPRIQRTSRPSLSRFAQFALIPLLFFHLPPFLTLHLHPFPPRCPFCESLVVPSLTIRVKDYRGIPRPTRQRLPSTPVSNSAFENMESEKLSLSNANDPRTPSSMDEPSVPPSCGSPLR